MTLPSPAEGREKLKAAGGEQMADPASMAYRSFGLGCYAVVVRYCTMPLEKTAMIMNSAQVSGSGQLAQASKIVFADGPFTPFRTVGRASIVAWFFQYSVMGFIFQACDRGLSSALGVAPVVYGDQLMEDASKDETAMTTAEAFKTAGKLALVPVVAGAIESGVANRAETQRFYGLAKSAAVEARIGANAFVRACGPAFGANAARNAIMATTSFVATPTLYRKYYPQSEKSKGSLFCFGLGLNIFFGNVLAITQQSLWGRALDSAAATGRPVSYAAVVSQGYKAEGLGAFITGPKWFSRVMMNAPIQGTMPWFYNNVLPLGEGLALAGVASALGTVAPRAKRPSVTLRGHGSGRERV